MKDNKQRSLWVDIVKGIAIIAVVLLHIEYAFPEYKLLPVTPILGGLWHVAVFFMVGGFFLKEEKICKPISFVKGKIKSLYLLILYIYIPVLLLHNVLIQIGFYDTSIAYDGKMVTWWGISETLKQIMMAICFAGREPILGAMWFVYVLFMALCLLSVISFFTRKLINDDRKYESLKMLILVALTIISCTMTQLYSLTIPRFSNVFTAALLIHVGFMMKNRWRFNFSSSTALALSLAVCWHVITIQGGVSLNSNSFHDVVTLVITSSASLYIISWLAKQIESSFTGKCIAYIGKESFYVMGLHFFGFKVCSLILISCGLGINLAELKAPAYDNTWLLFLYLIFGVSMPLAFMWVFRRIKNCLVQKTKFVNGNN